LLTQRFDSISGFVLAGGESRRMGQPKQRLVLSGETMLERQVRLLSSVCGRVSVVGPPVELAPPVVPYIPDLLAGRGPLGGIHAALSASRAEFNLVVACDLPFLKKRFLQQLAWVALRVGADVTIPEDKTRRLLPVCAVYRRRALGIIRGRLGHDLNKADGYFRDVRLHVVTWREILRAGFSAHIFDNINRPEEYEEARRRLEAY
jgi:molybdopterin-guanine dinucleotide biosynthesis protein A